VETITSGKGEVCKEVRNELEGLKSGTNHLARSKSGNITINVGKMKDTVI